MTWIHDDPKHFVTDALAGFAAANRKYVIPLDGGFVRAAAMAAGQVAVVIGGGSGHYPAFAGLVGPGLAAGAVCGNIFTSPSAAYAYRVAKAADAGGGVLFSYGNYAGDVLHFGQAQERLNAEGIETRTVLVTDDIASAPPTEVEKRRGIAGDLVVFKIAGAAAEAGHDLDAVERLARKANARTRTLGVAFGGCTLPGADRPLFTVPTGMMSLGLGIHGEPGISDHPLPRASELAALLVDRLLEEVPPDADGRVVAIVNGLGTVKYEELFLLFGKVEARLRSAGFEVIEPECGELVTSLDMAGVSLTLFWPDAELEPLWSAPADAPAYRKGSVAARPRRTIDLAAAASSTHEPASEQAVQLGRVAVAALEAIRRAVAENEAMLGQLDAVAGDGDHGIGMRQGADAAATAAAQAAAEGVGIHELLLTAGDAWAEHAGGTSGALWGAALTAVARAIGNKPTYAPADALVAARAARDVVLGLGGAELGDKTIVDALVPAVEAFETAAFSGEPLVTCLTRAAERAREAAAATAPLRPRKGRARPLAERSVGHPDPGATSFAIVLDALARFLAGAEAAS